MSADIAVEKLITNAIHTAFIKYPEGDGGPNLDYEWIPPEQSSHITKATFGLGRQRIPNCEKGLIARFCRLLGYKRPQTDAIRYERNAKITHVHDGDWDSGASGPSQRGQLLQ